MGAAVKHLLVVSLSLMLMCASLTPVLAQEEQEEEIPAIAGFNLQAYAPARILIAYAYTNNFSISHVSSMGKSLYKIVSGPTSIEFKAEEVDRYTFSIQIEYAVILNQSIQIAVFSGSNPPESVQFNVRGNKVRLDFTLTVTLEPRYPSAQEVAEQVVLQVSSKLADFEMRTNQIISLQNRNLETQWALIIFNTIVNVALLFAVVFWLRPRRVERR